MRKRITAGLQDYFGISRKEARGAFFLIIISLVMVWTPFVFRRWILPMVPTDSTGPTAAQLDSVRILLEKESGNTKRTYGKLYNREANASAKPFRFDPNTASVTILDSVGIPPFLSKRIEKFRQSGGKFHRKEDLLKIYDFPPELYKKLVAYIDLPAKQMAEKQYAGSRQPFQKENFSQQKKYPDRQIQPFDINAADTTQLIRLRGIGSKLALRIIKFRDALGGFYSKEQYPEIFGLDSLALSELGKFSKIETPVRKIRINTITARELSGHVYFRNKQMVSVLLNYRSQHGAFERAEDLLKTKVVDEETLKKISPYLSFGQ